MALLSGYDFYKDIEIDISKIDADLTWFPLPIPLGASVGISGMNTTDIFDEIGADYLKIAVTMADGTTQLYVEIEQWDDVNKKGLLWVSRDTWTITASSMIKVRIYFDANAEDNTTHVGTPGNRPEVWALKAVHLFPESAIDSTGNYDGIAHDVTYIDGPLGKGKAAGYNGTSTYIDVSNWPDIAGSSNKSFGFWHYLRNDADTFELDTDTRFILKAESGWYKHYNPSDGYQSIAEIPLEAFDAWIRLWWVFRNSGQILDLYYNGSLVGSISVSQIDLGSSKAIGAYYTGLKKNIDADVDNYFLVDSAVSAAWIKADYHAQTDNLLTFGATNLIGMIEIEDISLDLSAYYQVRTDLAIILSATDGIVLQNLEIFLKTYGQSIEDLYTELSAYFQDRQDITAQLKTLAIGWQGLPTALQAMGLGREDLSTQFKALARTSRDLTTVLAAVTPLLFRDLGLALSATDGTATNDLSTVLAAVKRVPQYKSVVAQRIKSVISEVT